MGSSLELIKVSFFLLFKLTACCLIVIHEAAGNLVSFVAVLIGVFRRIRLTRRGFSPQTKTIINQ